jgi:hypothetical protein
MAYMSARELLSGLPVKMAHGGPVHTSSGEPLYGKGATAADLLAAEQRVLGEIAADPSGWDVETAYNAILESGVTIDDALAAGVKQTTIDAIFRSGAPLPETFSTPSTVTSGFAAAPYAGQDLQPFYTQAQDYVTRLMDDGVIDEAERREAQTLATRGGFTFQDFAAAGVDPSILFTQPAAKEPDAPINVDPALLPGLTDAEKAAQLAASQAAFTNTQPEYVTPTVYQPLPDNTSVYAAGEESLDRTFRDSAPRTEVLDSYGNLTNFDYTPAASLRSATGSGYNWTPPTVTGRPRSLMGADLLARYTGGRSAADLRQLTTGLGNGRTYSDYTGVLQNPGAYGGGLSKSQLYSRMRGLDYQLDKAAAADREASRVRGTIADYLAKYEDVRRDYARAKEAGEIPANQTPEAFARNHYNKYGRFDRAFTLIEAAGDTGGGVLPIDEFKPNLSSGMGGYEGEGDNYGATNWNQRYDMGKAGGVTRPFAHGGSVKKPQGFDDGGTVSSDLTNEELQAQLIALDAQAAPVEEPLDQEQTESRNILDRLISTTPAGSLFITEDTAAEVNPDNIQRDIPRMEWDGVDRPTPMRPETESKNMLETLASGYPKAVSTVGNYFVQPDETTASQADMSLIPMGELASDTKALGGMLYEALKEDPVAFFAENLPVVAQIVAGMDMNEFTELANEARDAGDSGLADMYEQIVVLSATGIIPGGAAANKAAKTTAIKAARDAAKITTESAEMLSTLTGDAATETPTVAPEVGEAAQLLEKVESLRPEITTEIGARTRVGETGRYVGAPEGIDSPQKLASLTRAITGLTKEGEFGRFWYERSGRQILDLTGGNKDDAEKLIQAIAITSANTPVAANFDFALQAFYQWKNGQPIKTGMYTTAMSKKLQRMFDGEEWAGRKTNNFYNNLMREVDPSKVQGVTTDLWMMRAFGFDKDAPQPKEYTFVENETKRIAKKLGWEPQQVQAAIWVALKSRMENQGVKDVVEARSIENGWMHYETIDGKKVRVVDDQNKHAANWLGEAMKHTPTDADRTAAGFDYADAAQNNLAQVSWESIPSRTSGHMPEIFEATPEVVQDYHVQMSKAFLDDKGNDIIAQQLGILSPGDFEAPGYFELRTSPGTQTELVLPRAYGVTRRTDEIRKQAKANARPEEAAALGPTVEATSTGLAEPFVGPRAAAFEKDVLAADLREATYVTETAAREAMFAYAAVRGILLKQDGVGLHRPAFINGLSRPKANGIEVNIGRPLTADETSRVARAVAKEAGHTEYNPIGSPNGFRLINFGGMSNTEFQKVVNNALEKVTFEGGIPYNAKMFGADTGYLGNNWTENLNGEGYLDIGELAGRPDLQRKIRDIVTQLAPRVSAVEDEFAGRYNWTRNRGLNSSYEAPQAQGIGSLPDTPLPAQSPLVRNARGKIVFESFAKKPDEGYGNLKKAREILKVTDDDIRKFKAENKGVKQVRVPEVKAAAIQLQAGEITTDAYLKVVEEFQPITPLGELQKVPTNKVIAMALGKNELTSAGIVGENLDVPNGTRISSRLDVSAYEDNDTWVVTLHDGTIESGNAVGYAPTAVLTDVTFTSKPEQALRMATDQSNKGTIARINGSWENRSPAEVEQLARDILSGKAPDADDWVEVGMNPFRHSYFYRKSDGMPVASAEEVIQVGPLVLARKPKTRPIESPEHLIKTPEGTPPTYFKKGGAIERVYNDRRYI